MVYFFVGISGILGAILRYEMGKWLVWPDGTLFPASTFIVNLSGCFILAFFYTAIATRFTVHPYFRTAFGTGLIGSFTTFSTFCKESFELMREGHWVTAIAYMLFSLIGGYLCAYAGVKLGTFKRKAAAEQEGGA
ncbi:fluoride efflux transporter CrcB [Paenibacillus caui]|uniref:fluoride efflux transporter CrcB n=1 Tax=Paenibacillus caui TaxID=2873927 RepID=UPI001CA9887E|nr:fluoride efflux transporter CrcB [Paenibacillus caui]